MLILSVRIGSSLWRIRNYSFFASLKYLYTEKINKQVYISSKNESITSLSELNEKFFKVSSKEVSDLESKSDNVFMDISKKLITLETNGSSIKKGIIGSTGTINRLNVLAYMIEYSNFDLIIESGTQHGISALFMEEFISAKNCLLYSLDVQSNTMPKGIGICHFVILRKPVRRSFKQITMNLVNGKSKTLFFHDSDHSYENMTFEFDWAWNELKVECLISDDVSENLAFYNFVKRNNLTAHYCKFDSGPLVGLVVRV